MSKQELDNHANQLNPNNPAYWKLIDNRANQLNPNNIRYWLSRGVEPPKKAQLPRVKKKK